MWRHLVNARLKCNRGDEQTTQSLKPCSHIRDDTTQPTLRGATRLWRGIKIVAYQFLVVRSYRYGKPVITSYPYATKPICQSRFIKTSFSSVRQGLATFWCHKEVLNSGAVPRGPRAAPSDISASRAPPKKVHDKAVTCQNFQKACSALVVILMLSCFVTF